VASMAKSRGNETSQAMNKTSPQKGSIKRTKKSKEAEQIDKLKKELKQTKAELRSANKEIRQLEQKLTTETKKVAKLQDKARSKYEEARQQYTSKIAKMKTLHAEALKNLAQEHATELASERSKLRREHMRAMDRLETHWENKSKEMLYNHADTLYDLEIKHGEEIDALQIAANEKLEAKLAEAKNQHRRDIFATVIRYTREIKNLEGQKSAMKSVLKELNKKHKDSERNATQAILVQQKKYEAACKKYENLLTVIQSRYSDKSKEAIQRRMSMPAPMSLRPHKKSDER